MDEYAYSDIPLELQTEFLLKQSPTALISHCKINASAKKTCNQITFWDNYIFGVDERETNKLILDIAKENQDLVPLVFDAITKRYGPREKSITTILLFWAIMRNDTKSVDKFKTLLGVIVDIPKIIKATNRVINLINSGDYRSIDHTNEIFIDFYAKISPFYDANYSTGYLIHEIIYGRLKTDAVHNIPAWTAYVMDEEGDEVPGYNDFIYHLFKILARKSNVGDLLNLLTNYKNEKRNLNHFYQIIGTFIPTKLYRYVESYILENIGEKINLTDGVMYYIDKDHLNKYITSYDQIIILYRSMMKMEPEEYAETVYESNLLPERKKWFIDAMLKSDDSKWNTRLKRRWNELTKG